MARDKSKVERLGPQFSINSLSEYLVSNALRRGRILEEQKRPRSFQVTYYREALKAIAEYVAHSDEPGILARAERELSSGAGKEWEISRCLAGKEAISAYRRSAEKFTTEGFKVRLGPTSPRRLELAGVSVSVRPELLLETEGGDTVGGVKLFFSKNKAVGEERARITGTILYRYLQSVRGAAPQHKACFVWDIFHGATYSAPRTYKRRLQEVQAGCAEISQRWPFV